jgi:hypothetical protein
MKIFINILVKKFFECVICFFFEKKEIEFFKTWFSQYVENFHYFCEGSPTKNKNAETTLEFFLPKFLSHKKRFDAHFKIRFAHLKHHETALYIRNSTLLFQVWWIFVRFENIYKYFHHWQSLAQQSTKCSWEFCWLFFMTILWIILQRENCEFLLGLKIFINIFITDKFLHNSTKFSSEFCWLFFIRENCEFLLGLKIFINIFVTDKILHNSPQNFRDKFVDYFSWQFCEPFCKEKTVNFSQVWKYL